MGVPVFAVIAAKKVHGHIMQTTRIPSRNSRNSTGLITKTRYRIRNADGGMRTLTMPAEKVENGIRITRNADIKLPPNGAKRIGNIYGITTAPGVI